MKERLDVILVSQGYAPSREKAKAIIMAGNVFINGQREDKAGQTFDLEKIKTLEVKGSTLKYVSRGGLKLEKALAAFPLSVGGKVCMDIGASTGGFTDCMLQNGATKVYAIDVGYGQLDYKLRIDERVVNMEKCNVRYLDPETIAEPINFISIDVSFISLKLIFPVCAKVLADNGQIVCLVKPQFEAGREQVGKKGIVRDKNVHKEVIENVIKYAEDNGFYPVGLTFSPVTGAKGNIEYLLALSKSQDMCYDVSCIQDVVENSHAELE